MAMARACGSTSGILSRDEVGLFAVWMRRHKQLALIGSCAMLT
jgi:hypothetical protein